MLLPSSNPRIRLHKGGRKDRFSLHVVTLPGSGQADGQQAGGGGREMFHPSGLVCIVDSGDGLSEEGLTVSR